MKSLQMNIMKHRILRHMIVKLPLKCRIPFLVNQKEYVLKLNSCCHVRGDVLNFCGCLLSD